jgi:hypothetical protein
MDYKDFTDIFTDIMPIVAKAAPIIGSLVGGPVTGTIVALIGAVMESNPCDHCALLEKLKGDPDLFAKLQKLDGTHGDWLKKLS